MTKVRESAPRRRLRFRHRLERDDDRLAFSADRILRECLQRRRRDERAVADVESRLVPRTVERVAANLALGERRAVMRAVCLKGAEPVGIADKERLRVPFANLGHPHRDVRLDRSCFRCHGRAPRRLERVQSTRAQRVASRAAGRGAVRPSGGRGCRAPRSRPAPPKRSPHRGTSPRRRGWRRSSSRSHRPCEPTWRARRRRCRRGDRRPRGRGVPVFMSMVSVLLFAVKPQCTSLPIA